MGNRQDTNSSKQSLKDKLMAIILLETAKDYKEMDCDLVTECVDFLMELEGKERLTNEEIKQKVDEIPFKGKITSFDSHKKKIRTKRIIVIAAVLAILLTVFSILAISFTNIEDRLINRFANYFGEEAKPGEKMNIENIELIKPNDTKTYSSAQELVRDENIAILFPTWLPDGNRITECRYFEDDICGDFYSLCSEDRNYCISIYLEKNLSEKTKSSNPIKIVDNRTVYVISDDGYTQGDFEHNGYYYSVSARTEEEVLNIIENLKEIR